MKAISLLSFVLCSLIQSAHGYLNSSICMKWEARRSLVSAQEIVNAYEARSVLAAHRYRKNLYSPLRKNTWTIIIASAGS
ncbi:unnamed protein product [Heterobilharzia americana]|nr:unnamed protein product [Heterobilharzia americana]